MEKRYIQTWNKATKIRRWPIIGQYLYDSLQWCCGKITGHEPSKTEWGYGGGEYADCWCRWCNKLIKVQKTVVMFQHKDVNAKELMSEVKTEIEI